MTDLDLTPHPIEPVAQFTLNHDTPYHQLALRRVHDAAMEAYEIRRHEARYHEDLDESAAHEQALSSALAVAGRSYAAAALNQAVHVLGNRLGEDVLLALGDTAAELDLAVVEDLDGANGTGDDEGPEVRVFHRADGWTLPSLSPDVQTCTSNHDRQQAGEPLCSATAVWKVVELHGLVTTIGFWCDDDMPAEHRRLAQRADA